MNTLAVYPAGKRTIIMNVGNSYSENEKLVFFCESLAYITVYQSVDGKDWQYLGQSHTSTYDEFKITRTKPYLKIDLTQNAAGASGCSLNTMPATEVPIKLLLAQSVAQKTANFNSNSILASDLNVSGTYFAIQAVGTASDEFNLATVIQESNDNSTWTNVAVQQSFTDVNSPNDYQVKTFTPTKTYIRFSSTLTGDPAEATVIQVFGRTQFTGTLFAIDGLSPRINYNSTIGSPISTVQRQLYNFIAIVYTNDTTVITTINGVNSELMTMPSATFSYQKIEPVDDHIYNSNTAPGSPISYSTIFLRVPK